MTWGVFGEVDGLCTYSLEMHTPTTFQLCKQNILHTMLTELLKFMLPSNNVYGTQRPANIVKSALSTTNFMFSVFDTIVAR